VEVPGGEPAVALAIKGSAPAVTVGECSLVLLARGRPGRSWAIAAGGKGIEVALASLWEDLPVQPCTPRTECDLLAQCSEAHLRPPRGKLAKSNTFSREQHFSQECIDI
jgi:hypothetical protein